MNYQIYNIDAKDIDLYLDDNSIDAIVTDPPYGLSFMGKRWDYDVPSEAIWRECLRVLKPGGHLLAFAGTRTQHRMTARIEDAGFEIRDMIAWVYGSGFPKSRNISADMEESYNADVWQGWGTALKPALEPITVARKPLAGTVAENVLAHGTGALNIDGCRVPTGDKLGGGHSSAGQQMTGGWERPWMSDPDAVAANAERSRLAVARAEELGRWPANLIHDGSEEVLVGFPHTASGKMKAGTPYPGGNVYGAPSGVTKSDTIGDSGSAARFFYCAKASKSDRDEGLESFADKQASGLPMRSATGERGGAGIDGSKTDRLTVRKNNHPTVKPTDLMRYLCRLVTPRGGVVLDPFMGSGSTGKAAMLEGFRFIGVEREAQYMAIAKARIEAAIASQWKAAA